MVIFSLLFFIFFSCSGIENSQLEEFNVVNYENLNFKLEKDIFIYTIELPAKYSNFTFKAKPYSEKSKVFIYGDETNSNFSAKVYSMNLIPGENILILDVVNNISLSRYVFRILKKEPSPEFVNYSLAILKGRFKFFNINKIKKIGFILSDSSDIKNLSDAREITKEGRFYYYDTLSEIIVTEAEFIYFEKIVTPLTPKKYYVRAFVIDDFGISYLSNLSDFTVN